MADTIFAPATGSGKSAVAVIRISGPDAHHAISEITGRKPPSPRMLMLRDVLDPLGERIDEALLVIFRENESFTGEASAEIQCHGGPAVVSGILDRLGGISGCRLAEPGEFTRRALMNGKLDLTQAEGLGDLIDAETSFQGIEHDGWFPIGQV
jgi:tRNA modification GTPase